MPYQATSLATIVQMVANGIGITLLPGMAVESGIATNTSLAVRQFDQTNVTRQIGLMWRKKTPRRVEFRQLGELIAELANRRGSVSSVNVDDLCRGAPHYVGCETNHCPV